MTWITYPLFSVLVLWTFSGSLLAQSLAGQLASQRRNAPAAMQTLGQVLADDATLHDITFVDAQHGWAVGDRGVILATDDGGAHWHAQTSGVETPLLSVSFVDPQRGWIVGGNTTPLTHRTNGIVLRTFDGGQTWERTETPTLPRLTHVQFFDAAHGMAAGYGSSFYPSGVFVTQDGGRRWQPLAGSNQSTWVAGSFIDADTGFLAGPDSARGLVFDRKLTTPPMATADSRQPLGLSATSATEAWMVGGDGLVLHTTDSGTTWQPPATPPVTLSPAMSSAWQWTTVAARGNRVWITGLPGSVIAHSPDAGATWTLQPTGGNTPLEKIAFVDDQRGWAVGTLGTILATDDGGRNWRRQRGGGRAAMLAMTTAPVASPVEVAARYAAGDGYRTTVLPLFNSTATDTAASDSHRVAEALAYCGTNYQRPLWSAAVPPVGFHQSPQQLFEELNRQSDGQAGERLLAKLVLSLRTWQPEVLLVPHQRNDSSDADAVLVEHLVRLAIQRAADPMQDADLTALGVAPWQVKRTVGLLPEGERGTIRLATDDFVPALGGSPARQASPARGLLFTHHTVPAPLLEMEIVDQQSGLASSTRDPFAGLNLPSGSDARRQVVASNPSDLDRLRKLSQKRGQLVRLLEYGEGSPVWSAQVVQLTGGLDPDTGGELLYQLAEGYLSTGRQAMAADTMYLLAWRYPDHPLTEQALSWLVKYYASSEIAHTTGLRQAKQVRARPLANVDGQAAPAELPPSEGAGTSDLDADGRRKRATTLGDYLSKARPALYAEPALRFPLAVAARHLGFDNTADRYFMILAKQETSEGWSTAAEAETWLAKPDQLPPNKPTATCKAVAEPPHLDGVLDEAFWQQTQPLRVATGAGRDDMTAAEVRLARDERFLYVSIRAPRLAGEDYPVADGARPRDADLSAFDRVELSLDVDRDYSTAFRLTVDCRGWTHDSCWGDTSWNPQWYVAQKATDQDWTIEMAVPWSELAEECPAVLDAWCLRVVRQTSRGHAASWTGAVDESPESFGLLLFR